MTEDEKNDKITKMLLLQDELTQLEKVKIITFSGLIANLDERLAVLLRMSALQREGMEYLH